MDERYPCANREEQKLERWEVADQTAIADQQFVSVPHKIRILFDDIGRTAANVAMMVLDEVANGPAHSRGIPDHLADNAEMVGARSQTEDQAEFTHACDARAQSSSNRTTLPNDSTFS